MRDRTHRRPLGALLVAGAIALAGGCGEAALGQGGGEAAPSDATLAPEEDGGPGGAPEIDARGEEAPDVVSVGEPEPSPDAGLDAAPAEAEDVEESEDDGEGGDADPEDTSDAGDGGDVVDCEADPSAAECLPEAPARLCYPCLNHEDCIADGAGADGAEAPEDDGARCVSFAGAGDFCGMACFGGLCPAGYECEPVPAFDKSAITQCVPADGPCGCTDLAIEDEAATTCEETNGFGTCAGEQACSEEGMGTCSAPAASAESCNLEDDDCDGQVDEEGASGCTLYYFDGDGDGTGVSELHKCTCFVDDEYTATVGEDCNDQDAAISPFAAEACNGLDDDCDDSIDEGFYDLDGDGKADCAAPDSDGDGVPDDVDGCPEAPDPGQEDLDGDGLGDVCDPDLDGDGATNEEDCAPADPLFHPAAPEACDTVDQNCDGLLNDGFPDLDSDGVADCIDIDKDGDGWVDEEDICPLAADPDQEDFDLDGLGDACDPDDDEDGVDDDLDCAPLDPAIHTDVPEVCNGLDDNCDGQVDEEGAEGCKAFFLDSDDDDWGDPEVDPRCLCEPEEAGGYSASTGFDCDDEEAEVFPGAPELCNGQDDDCDEKGDAIDGWIQLGQPCDGDDADACDNGQLVCAEDGQGLVCGLEPEVPEAELCNGLDDDCDGATDEDFVDLGGPCDGDDEDGCANGAWVCSEDGQGLDCPAEEPADTTEICNFQDDDCDGLPDEDFPDLGLPCDGDDADSCETGITLCAPDGSGTTCVEEGLGPGGDELESCNGFDDDCDGLTDEGFDLLGTPCDGGDADGCALGAYVCSGAGTGVTCFEEGAGLQELCGGGDEDCDGAVDEGFVDLLGEACDGEDDDQCAEGQWACSDDGLGVVCEEAGPGHVELCNGLDEDCDGEIDEDFSELGTPCDGPDSDLCEHGKWTCAPDQQGVACQSELIVDIVEMCNFGDDDCDGETDEEWPVGAPCDGPDSDQCMNGTLLCDVIGEGVMCSDETAMDLVDICDGTDEDCDGETDEGYDVGAPCDGEDDDLCKSGTIQCTEAGTSACVEMLHLEESCNGLDDDCDGTTDEGCIETSITIPPEDASAPAVAEPAATGLCGRFGIFGGGPNVHLHTNLDAWMATLQSGAGAAALTEVLVPRLNYASFNLGSCVSPGDFPGSMAVPINANGNLAARFRGYLNIPEAGVWTLSTVGNDSIRVSIGGQQLSLLSWSGLGWKHTVAVKFLAAGVYPLEVRWASNQVCGIDPLELSWAPGKVEGHDGVMHCGPGSGGCAWKTPQGPYSLIEGPSLLPTADGAAPGLPGGTPPGSEAFECLQCGTDADCPPGQVCNEAGVCHP